jgi:hypothetical protein
MREVLEIFQPFVKTAIDYDRTVIPRMVKTALREEYSMFLIRAAAYRVYRRLQRMRRRTPPADSWNYILESLNNEMHTALREGKAPHSPRNEGSSRFGVPQYPPRRDIEGRTDTCRNQNREESDRSARSGASPQRATGALSPSGEVVFSDYFDENANSGRALDSLLKQMDNEEFTRAVQNLLVKRPWNSG